MPKQNPVRGCASKKVYMVQKQHGSPPSHDNEQFFLWFNCFCNSTVSSDGLREGNACGTKTELHGIRSDSHKLVRPAGLSLCPKTGDSLLVDIPGIFWPEKSRLRRGGQPFLFGLVYFDAVGYGCTAFCNSIFCYLMIAFNTVVTARCY